MGMGSFCFWKHVSNIFYFQICIFFRLYFRVSVYLPWSFVLVIQGDGCLATAEAVTSFDYLLTVTIIYGISPIFSTLVSEKTWCLPGGHVKINSTSCVVCEFGCNVLALHLVQLTILIPLCHFALLQYLHFPPHLVKESISISVSSGFLTVWKSQSKYLNHYLRFIA